MTALIGPTAVGKTDVSIELARRLGAEIVGCDSMQVYRRMPALTTQPDAAQRAQVPHHLIDFVEPTDNFNVGQYRGLALQTIDELRQRGKAALVVGGTGLYLRALTNGLCEAPPADEQVRAELTAEAEAHGSPALHAKLARIDAAAAEKIHPNDARRVIRALEVHQLTGKPLSSFWGWGGRRARTVAATSAGEVVPMTIIGLTREREDLNDRINRRVEAMIDDPRVLDEVRVVSGLPLSRTARQVHGLRFLEPFVRGEQRRDEAVPLWQQQVRQYARRQLIWFRAEPGIQWLTLAPSEPADQTVERICKLLRVRMIHDTA